MPGSKPPRPPARAPHPRSLRRRATDRLRPKDGWYLLGIALVIASLWTARIAASEATSAAKVASGADVHALQALSRLQEGRATALSVTCAVVSAISEQGRAVLVSSATSPETPFTRALERLGYPPPSVRHKQASAAGEAYVLGISQRVDRELAQRGRRPIRGLVRPDGTLDCRVLQRVSAIPNPR